MNSTKPEIKKLRIRLYSLDGNIAKHKNKSIFSSISSSLPLKAGNVRLSKYFNPSIVSHLISMPNCWNIFLFRTVLVLIELNVIDPVKFAKRFFSLLNDLWSKFKVTCSLSYAFLHLKRRFKTHLFRSGLIYASQLLSAYSTLQESSEKSAIVPT